MIFVKYLKNGEKDWDGLERLPAFRYLDKRKKERDRKRAFWTDLFTSVTIWSVMTALYALAAYAIYFHDVPKIAKIIRHFFP